MRIQYLGTAAAEGIPAIWCNCEVCQRVRKTMGPDFRTRSQALIDGKLMVDFPPDAYWHMFNNGLNYSEIKNVIFTHSHQDHFYPEEFAMRSEGYANNISGPINVYGNAEIVRRMNTTQEMQIPERVVVHELKEFEPVTIDGYIVTPLKAHHDPRENCLNFIIEKDGKRILYGNDTGTWFDETWDYIEHNRLFLDLVSMDCTMGIQSRTYWGHMGIKDVRSTVARLREDGLIDESSKLIVTHFSHNLYIYYDELKEMLKDEGIVPTYDGMTVEI